LEYAAATLAILGYLAWRSINQGGVDWVQTVVFFALPDVAAFVPIGLSSKRRDWPKWGANLYNAFHTLLVWGLAFAVSFVASRGIYWPLLGWLLHITLDRAAGYGLRKSGVSA
jgi:Domain of unknown function (DUF4260)